MVMTVSRDGTSAMPKRLCRNRIVPGFPGAEKEALFREWGCDDPLAVAAEPFHVWVIQGPKAIAAELPLAEAGLNVVWTGDPRPYRARKVRLLNGGHTSTVLAAYLAGLDTVEEMTLAFSLAALLWFYRGERQADGLVGRREQGFYPIRDDAHALDIMSAT